MISRMKVIASRVSQILWKLKSGTYGDMMELADMKVLEAFAPRAWEFKSLYLHHSSNLT